MGDGAGLGSAGELVNVDHYVNMGCRGTKVRVDDKERILDRDTKLGMDRVGCNRERSREKEWRREGG